MSSQINYKSAPEDINEALISSIQVEDFLPPPELLIPKEETKKITITLSKRSIDFFKEVSRKTDIPYQQMIRKVLDTYTEHYIKCKSDDV